MEEVEKSYPGKNFIWEIGNSIDLPKGTIFRIKNRVKNENTEKKVLY